jgi:putative FmdB family regulatory protein
MPIFEYTCTACGESFSKLQFGAGSEGVKCPKCESIEVERQLSTFASASSGTEAAACPSAANCSSGFS